jgi:general nucleoside transport system permease protein
MDALFTQTFLAALLFGSVTAAVPLLLAGLGEQLSEKAGVMNIGLEGMVLAGTYMGFFVAVATGSPFLGFLGGTVLGGLVACVMAVFCVRFGMNQTIIGIAITLTVQGLTSLLHYFQFSRTYPRLPASYRLPISGLSDIPVIGSGLFNHHPLVYLSVALVGVFTVLYRRTFLGLNLEAAGDKPAALDAAGIDVVRTRTFAVLGTGALAGLGGAYMAQVGAGLFVPLMSNGAGYIGIVLAMLARGRPIWVLFGALLFGCCLSATTALQVAGVNVPSDIIQMLPFVMVMLVLVCFGRKASPPAALGIPYFRGQR